LAARSKKSKKSAKNPIPKKYLYILLILLGAFLGNLDRLGRFGHSLIGFGNFLPRYIRLVIPGYGADFTTAQSGTELYGKVFKVYDGDTITLFPMEFSCSASRDYVSWTVKLKNYGAYSEGLFADCPAAIGFSTDGNDWVTLFTGYVSTSGMSRETGYLTDDYVTFDLVDRTQGKGTKRTPDSAIYAGLEICDPSDTGNSILHRLAALMGVETCNVSTIPDVKDIVALGNNTVWAELKLLRDAYGASMYFDNLGRLLFRSFLDADWTELESEWTFVADPSHPITEDAPPFSGH